MSWPFIAALGSAALRYSAEPAASQALAATSSTSTGRLDVSLDIADALGSVQRARGKAKEALIRSHNYDAGHRLFARFVLAVRRRKAQQEKSGQALLSLTWVA